MSKAKQAILRAIAIKLEVETHKKYRKVMTKIAWFAFLIFLGFGLYNSVTRYLDATDILSDPVYLEANVEELDSEVSDTQSSYRYSFDVDGKSYAKDFVASYQSYEKYMGEEGVNIVYKKSDPSHSEIAYLVEKNNSVGGIFKHFAMMFFFGGLGFMVIYMFLTNGIVQPTEEYEDDEEIDS